MHRRVIRMQFESKAYPGSNLSPLEGKSWNQMPGGRGGRGEGGGGAPGGIDRGHPGNRAGSAARAHRKRNAVGLAERVLRCLLVGQAVLVEVVYQQSASHPGAD